MSEQPKGGLHVWNRKSSSLFRRARFEKQNGAHRCVNETTEVMTEVRNKCLYFM
jgi:hypothetical protein